MVLVGQILKPKTVARSISRAGLLQISLLAAAAFFAPQTNAQELQGPSFMEAGRTEMPLVRPACIVHPMPSADEGFEAARLPVGTVILLASCSGTGVILGEADSYRLHFNPTSGAVVASIERAGRARVMLMQRDIDGLLAVEDITGDLAVAAGRNPTSGLQGTTIDYTGFARDGLIAVARESQHGHSNGDSSQSRVPFSLSEHNARRQAAGPRPETASSGDAQ